MSKAKLWFMALFILASSAALPHQVRKAVWAGAFYEGDRQILSAQIDNFFKNVADLPSLQAEVAALICPHAGYVYSGQTAAYGYRLVQEKPYETVILIGPSHQYGFEGCSIFLRGGFETPLGVAEIDEEIAAEIARLTKFSYVAAAHEKEHSLEVHLPFLQKALPRAKIVPIVMGYPTRKTISTLADALTKVLAKKKILVVASTDMSHYLPAEEARSTDSRTISLLQKLDTNTIINKLARGENFMCGGGPVASTLLALKKKGQPRVEVLRYSDSSRFGGPIVGYLAAAVTLESGPQPEFKLTPEEKKELIALAWKAIREFVGRHRVLEYETQNPNLLTERGAFVTLKKKGELRGCIGFIEPLFPLYEAVARAAIYAATEDPRFKPATEDELRELEIEISVLTPLQKIENPRLIQVGKHGLLIARGQNKGLLLPQVAIEQKWDRETFLSQACLKAGLPPDAWKKGAEIYVFEAIIFR